MAKHDEVSPSEPHTYVKVSAEDHYECEVCGDDEGGDLHVSREFTLYIVSAGESLAEALQDTASPVFDTIEAARQYAADNMPGDVDSDADDFIFRFAVTVQAFDMERMSDD